MKLLKITIQILFITAYLLPIKSILAKHSDIFPMGSYSYIQNTDKFFLENKTKLARMLKELGYNITVMDTNNNDKGLSDLLGILDSNEIDAILTDKCWSNDPNNSRHYALVAISTSNYQRFEAEFSDETAVKPEDINSSVYWYGTQIGKNNQQLPKRVGRVNFDPDASYENAWKCIPGKDQEGFAYTDITYRWKDNNGNATKLSDEIRYYNTHQEQDKNADSVYISLRIKVENIKPQMRSDAVLFSFTPMGFKGRPTEFVDSVQLSLSNSAAPTALLNKSNSLGSKAQREVRLARKQGNPGDFTYADYLALGSPTGYFELEYAISFKQLLSTGLLSGDLDFNPNTGDSWWWIVQRGFSPRLYWYGNCELSLDCIDLEDQLHRNFRTQPELYKTKINQRLRDFTTIPHGDIIRYFYTMDEPFQPQLNSYKELQEIVSPDLPPTFTTFYDIMHHKFAMADNKSWFDHVDLARTYVKPRILLTDIYPIKPNISFNPDKPNFLQDVLDNQLIKTYTDSKDYCLLDNQRKFYPITQIFGYWDSVNWLSWMQPPAATQKALLYLPLCFQPNGVFSYRLHGFIQPNGAGEYAAVSAMPDGSVIENSYIWDTVVKANPRIEYYGNLLKDWQWLGVDTAFTKSKNLSSRLARSGIVNTSVAKSGKAIYYGYIECGYYLDNNERGAIFAVNRRTNYFTGKDKDKYPASGKVPPQMYADYYQEFEPQTLVVTLDADAVVNNPALYDPMDKKLYPSKKQVVQVELAAGEGKLLQLVTCLPSKVKKGTRTYAGPIYIHDKAVIPKKANVICDGDLILMPGSSLTVKKGGSLTVNGKLIRSDGSNLKSVGTLKLNKQ
jgi:hypothetical protein